MIVSISSLYEKKMKRKMCQRNEKTSWPSLQYFERKCVDPAFLFSIELAIVANLLK